MLNEGSAIAISLRFDLARELHGKALSDHLAPDSATASFGSR